MRALVQRVSTAAVTVGSRHSGAIGPGLLIFLGVGGGDTPADARYLARKIVDLRIFEDPQGKMNRCLRDTGGEALVVSQFTLYADCRRGRRPSFTGAAPPDEAHRRYRDFIAALEDAGVRVATGAFQETMQVSLTNDGPATFLLDSARLF
jgi:D-tyrosyl-tRNA(Tyr) deacylase